MNTVKRWTVITLCGAALAWNAPGAQAQSEVPAQWTLQQCIDYALQQNLSIRKNRINSESSLIDVKTAKAALFPSLSFSTSQNMVNRPYQESSNIVNGSEVLSTNSKTSYNGNYGLNAQWTVYNGNKRTNTIKQQKLNNQIAELNVGEAENSIQESIMQTYMQILYAAESIKVNEGTLTVSEAQRDRGKQLLAAGSISKADLAQLESQVSADRYNLVNAEASLQNYKLQLKQLLELGGEEEMQVYLPALGNELVLTPLPTRTEVYQAALSHRPEIESGKLNMQASDLEVSIARAGYLPTVSLSAGIGTNNTSGSDFTFAEQMKNGWNNSLGLSISVPIFNNRQTKSAVQKAKLQQETSQLNLLDDQKTLYKTIESIWLDANTAQQSFVAAQEKLHSAQTSFDLVSEQFNLGMKNTVEMLTEKNNLQAAQQSMLQAKYMAVMSIQMLQFYQGSGFSLPG